MNYRGLTKEEYINLLKECNMCTKKWTYARWKHFEERRLEILREKNNVGILPKLKRIFRKKKRG